MSNSETGSFVVSKAADGRFRMVKGCPCYKEFGTDKICVNNDDVIPIKAISVDPAFLSHITSLEELLEYRSEAGGMCYLLTTLDNEQDKVHCVSRGERLVINKRHVRASDLEAALRFVTLTGLPGDGAVCSSCLYKYIVTLSDMFDDVVDEREKAEIIVSYVRDLAIEIVMGLNGVNHSESESQPDKQTLLASHVKSVVEQRTKLSELIRKLRQEEKEELLIALVDDYRQICRLEAIFLFQVESLLDAKDEIVSLGLLKYMMDVADRVLRMIDSIRDKTYRLEMQELLSQKILTVLEPHIIKRKRLEQRFSNLMKVLSEIKT